MSQRAASWLAHSPNPTGIEQATGAIELIMNILIFVISGIVLVIAASVIVRFRRARGEGRQQLKWLAYAVGFLGTLVGIGVLNQQVLDRTSTQPVPTLTLVAVQ